MQESLQAGQGFTDNEVTLVIDGRSHILSLTAQRLPEGLILLEMAPMDNQRRLSQSNFSMRSKLLPAIWCGARRMKSKPIGRITRGGAAVNQKRCRTLRWRSIPTSSLSRPTVCVTG